MGNVFGCERIDKLELRIAHLQARLTEIIKMQNDIRVLQDKSKSKSHPRIIEHYRAFNFRPNKPPLRTNERLIK